MKHVRERKEGGGDRTRAGEEERGGTGWCGAPRACAWLWLARSLDFVVPKYYVPPGRNFQPCARTWRPTPIKTNKDHQKLKKNKHLPFVEDQVCRSPS